MEVRSGLFLNVCMAGVEGGVSLNRGVILGTVRNELYKGSPLPCVPLFLACMIGKFGTKLPISKVAQVSGGIISQPSITCQVVPWRKFRRLEFANTQLGRNAGASFEIPMCTKHAMV